VPPHYGAILTAIAGLLGATAGAQYAAPKIAQQVIAATPPAARSSGLIPRTEPSTTRSDGPFLA
jgi:hypothetical protein